MFNKEIKFDKDWYERLRSNFDHIEGALVKHKPPKKLE